MRSGGAVRALAALRWDHIYPKISFWGLGVSFTVRVEKSWGRSAGQFVEKPNAEVTGPESVRFAGQEQEQNKSSRNKGVELLGAADRSTDTDISSKIKAIPLWPRSDLPVCKQPLG